MRANTVKKDIDKIFMHWVCILEGGILSLFLSSFLDYWSEIDKLNPNVPLTDFSNQFHFFWIHTLDFLTKFCWFVIPTLIVFIIYTIVIIGLILLKSSKLKSLIKRVNLFYYPVLILATSISLGLLCYVAYNRFGWECLCLGGRIDINVIIGSIVLQGLLILIISNIKLFKKIKLSRFHKNLCLINQKMSGSCTFCSANKKFFPIFFILAVIVWSSSWWAYWVFRWMDYPHPYSYSLRPVLMLNAMTFICLLALGHVTYQAIAVKNNNPLLLIRVLFYNIIGLCFVAFYALIVSVVQENTWALIIKSPYPFKYLITIILSAPGYGIIFLFFLALISGYMLYPPSDKFNKNEFLKLLAVWFFIIFINEMIFQRFIFTFRTSSIVDVFNDMLGGVLPGLTLSLKWFRK
jgi:hypothetical protein